jgi:hypothetical protein
MEIYDEQSDFTKEQFENLLKRSRDRIKFQDNYFKPDPQYAENLMKISDELKQKYLNGNWKMETIKFEDFQKELQTRKVEFIYKKKDGSERKALGTTNPDLIPLDKLKSKREEKDGFNPIQTYFDFDANDWRGFVKSNLISYVFGI